MSMTPLSAMVRKDLQVFFADRRAVLVSFAVPIAIASFFGFLFGGQSGKSSVSRIPVQIVDQDGSVISREITTNLAADKAIALKAASAAEARAAVQKGKAVVAVIVPRGFGEAAGRAFFGAAKKPELEFLYDPSHGAELGMVRGILTQYVMETVSKEMFRSTSGRQIMKESLDTLDQNPTMSAEDKKALRDMLQSIDKWYERSDRAKDPWGGPTAGGLKMPYTMREEAVTAGKDVKYNGFTHSFAGMGI